MLQNFIMPNTSINPFSVRLTPAERSVLAMAAAQANCSRNAFVRAAVVSLAVDLQQDHTVEA